MQILYSVLEMGAYANIDSLNRLEKADLNARDRSFASALVYGTLARIPSIDWLLAKASRRPVKSLDPWVRTILRLGVWQLYWSHSVPVSAAVNESVNLVYALTVKSAAGFINAVLRTLARREIELPSNKPAVYYSLPPEIYGYLKLWYQDQAPALAEAFLREPEGVVIRTNTLRGSAAELARDLAEEGIESIPGHYSPDALILKLDGRPVSSLRSYEKGKFMVQSEAAMMAALIMQPGAGEKIIDLCAAPGGKTCHLAELSEDRAMITARDIHYERLRLVEEHAGRLGLESITCQQGDAAGAGMNDQEIYDKVLLDAPCSGLGLMARKPEIRLNMSHERMINLYPLQKSMLDHAAALLKPGGVLVYSTCTINPAENIDAVNDLVQRSDGGLSLEPIDELLPDALIRENDLAVQARAGYLQFLPHLHATDGFFLARLRKKN